jgi:small GTP-binding protein
MLGASHYQTLLNNALDNVKEIDAIAIVLRNGLIVDSQFRNKEQNDEIIGAITAVFDNFAKRLEREFGSAKNFTNSVRIDDFKIFFVSAGPKAILTMVSNLSANDDELAHYGQIIGEKVSAIIDGENIDLEIQKYDNLKDLLPKGRFQMKLVVLGDARVGKTSLVNRFSKDQFDESYQPSVTLSISNKTLSLTEECIVDLNIWDIQGQLLQLEPIKQRIFKEIDAVIIEFDVTNRKSFDDIDRWVKNLKKWYAKEIPILIVGNKTDLPPAISSIELKKKSESLECDTILCSAKRNANVVEVFKSISTQILLKPTLTQ